MSREIGNLIVAAAIGAVIAYAFLTIALSLL